MDDIRQQEIEGRMPPEFAKDRFLKPDVFSDNKPNAVEVPQEKVELIKTESSVVIDPNTGMNKIVSDQYANEGAIKVGITDIDNIDNLKADMDNEENRDTLKDFGVKDEDMLTIFQLVRDYNAGKTSNMYSRLPATFKMQCGSVCPTRQLKDLNFAAKEFVKELAFQLNVNKEFLDIQTSLSEELDKLDIGAAYTDYNNKRMDKLQIIADQHKEAGDMDKYQKIMDIKEPYDDAISFVRLKEAAKTIRRLDKLVKRYDRNCEDFNYKYTHNTQYNFSITNVKSIGLCLKRHLPGDKYTEDDVMKFVMLFCRLCLNYNSEDIRDHVFMYFTIKEINLLDVYLQDKQEYKDIITKVEEVISIIRETEAAK